MIALRSAWLRGSVATAIVLACALAAHAGHAARASVRTPPPHGDVPSVALQPPARHEEATSARCALAGETARTMAHALERRAIAHWERAPFVPAEMSRAVQQMAEAEACFHAAGDRPGQARAATLHRRYRAQWLASARQGTPAGSP